MLIKPSVFLSRLLLCCFSASQLKPEQVDFHITENREVHKTDDYEAQQLIIRRGQTFDVTVTFNREYQPDSDVIILQFVTGWQLYIKYKIFN